MESRLPASLYRNARIAGPASPAVENRVSLPDLFRRETPMSLQDPTQDDGTVEECLDELNDFVATLGNYPPTVLAVAMRVHLESLLRALLERGQCTRQEIREFVKDLEREALQYDDS